MPCENMRWISENEIKELGFSLKKFMLTQKEYVLVQNLQSVMGIDKTYKTHLLGRDLVLYFKFRL